MAGGSAGSVSEDRRDRHRPADPPYPNPHSADERRTLSNVGHWVEGGVLGGVGALALVDAVRPDLEWPRRWGPRLTVGAGAALSGLILGGSLHHGGPRRYLRHEHQDRQHLTMAAVIAAGGAVERLTPGRAGGAGPAAALAAIGQMFLTHEQHGTGEARERAERAHRRLGLSLIAAGAARGADALGVPGPWRFAWPALALAVSGQLLTYREPPGAYE